MYFESLVSQENENLESNAATEKITSNESIPIGISSMQSVMDVVSGPTSHDNEQISIVNAGQENSTPPLNNENNSVNENVQVPGLISGPSTSSNACSFKMEKPKLPKFTGDVREYAIFKADFKHAIEARYTKRDLITFLRTCLHGKPLDLIKGIGTDYNAAWEYLDSIYGDLRFVSDTITQDIVKFRMLQDGEDARFCDLAQLGGVLTLLRKWAYPVIWIIVICCPLLNKKCALTIEKCGLENWNETERRSAFHLTGKTGENFAPDGTV